MRCAIMQPTYLPWAGYFNLMANVDLFVFLNDVQFERRSWQCRNRILINGSPQWLTVPTTSSQTDRIDEILVDDTQQWRKKHIKSLKWTYGRHPYAQELSDVLAIIEDQSITSLSELNIHLIKHFARRLRLEVQFKRANELGADGKRSNHLLSLCRLLGVTQYLSPQGSKDYLVSDAVFEGSGIQLSFQEFTPGCYPQRDCKSFTSHLSIIDVLTNLGAEAAAEYVHTGILINPPNSDTAIHG